MLKVAFDEAFIHPLPAGHRFPMEKYDLLPKQLIHEGTIEAHQLFSPAFCAYEDLNTVHDALYLQQLFDLKISPREQRKTGFVHSSSLIERESRIMEGTRKCAEFALSHGAAMNIAGGTHHAYSNRGEGFCLMNDQAIAAKWLLKNKLTTQVLIIDLDVHQGNGTAQVFANTPEVFTFSMHGKNNYPLKKEMSDCDVELEDGIGDTAYLKLLERHLSETLERFCPTFIFFQSGVDVLETDKLGRLGLSIEGCKKRDQFVFKKVKELGVPVVCSMGGGYSPDIRQIIEAHANTFREVQNFLF